MSENATIYTEGQSIRIAEWWLPKLNQMLQGKFHAVCFDNQAVLMKEREKSCQVKAHCFDLDGAWDQDLIICCPKRCLQTEEQYQKYQIQKRQTLLYQHRAEQIDRSKLIAFAKEHQIPVAKNWKTTTILKRIEKAGLTYDET